MLSIVLAATADVATGSVPVAPAWWAGYLAHPLVLGVLAAVLTQGFKIPLRLGDGGKGTLRAIAALLAALATVLSAAASGTLAHLDAGELARTAVDAVLVFLAATGAYKMAPKRPGT